MESEKPVKNIDVLEFLSPRLREILQRLSTADRRDELQELAWLIEGYAKGRLKDLGDDQPNPRVPLNDLPETLLVEAVQVRRVLRRVSEIDPLQPRA